jgi:hypothetical protein
MTPYAYPAAAFGVLLVVVVLLEFALKFVGKPLISSFTRWVTRRIHGGWALAFGLSMLLSHLFLTETVAMTPWRWIRLGILAMWTVTDVILSFRFFDRWPRFRRIRRWTFSAWFLVRRQRSRWWNVLPLGAGMPAGIALW